MVDTLDLRFGTNSNLTVLLDSTVVVNDKKDSLWLSLHVPMWLLAAFQNRSVQKTFHDDMDMTNTTNKLTVVPFYN